MLQIFDAMIIFSSFAIDIVFLGGVSGEEGQKAAAVLVVLLLWRIARVVDGKFTGDTFILESRDPRPSRSRHPPLISYPILNRKLTEGNRYVKRFYYYQF